MATKISFDEVVNAIQNASIPTEEADAIIKALKNINNETNNIKCWRSLIFTSLIFFPKTNSENCSACFFFFKFFS